MAIAAVGTPTVDAGNRTTSRTFSHTVDASADALVISVTMGYEDSAADEPGSVAFTYGGEALTQIAGWARNPTSACVAGLWLLLGPTTGANDLVCTWAGTSGGAKLITFVCQDFSGVHQSSAIGTAATATGTDNTATVNVSSAEGEMVVDAISATNASGAPPTTAPGADQTENTTGPGRSAESNLGNEGSLSYEAGAATVTMSWTISDVTNERWAIAAVPLKPAATASALPLVNAEMFMGFQKVGSLWQRARDIILPNPRPVLVPVGIAL